jgi:hypothetical protein
MSVVPKNNKFIRPSPNQPLYRELALLGARLFGNGFPENQTGQTRKDLDDAPDYASYRDTLTGNEWTKRNGEWIVIAPEPNPPDWDSYFHSVYPDFQTRPVYQCISDGADVWNEFRIGDPNENINPNPGTFQIADVSSPDAIELTNPASSPNIPCIFVINNLSEDLTIQVNVKMFQQFAPVNIKFGVITYDPASPPPFPLTNAQYATYQNLGTIESNTSETEWKIDITGLDLSASGGSGVQIGWHIALVDSTDSGFSPLCFIEEVSVEFTAQVV